MISEFNLTNFKAFAGPERIPIRPLTLIFGPNSSGKSSIFQCLLMLKQTLEQPPSHVTPLRVKGDLVDLSRYREFVYRHDQEENFTIGAVLHILNLKELDRLFCKFGFRAGNEYFSKLFQCIKKSQLGLQISFGYDEIRNRIRVSRIFLFIDDQVNPIVFYNGEFSIANKKHQFWKKYYKNCIKGNEQFFIDMILDNEQVKDDDKDKYIDKNIKIDNIEIAVELYHNYFSIY